MIEDRTLDCACGRTLRFPENSSARKIRCPKCRAVQEIPALDGEIRIVEELPPAPQVVRPPVRPRPAFRPAAAPRESSSLEGKIFRSGVLGGLAAMVVAVVWFVVGWHAGKIFIYPPILFVIGGGAAIKGLLD